jgi:hypothetical protein
MVHAQRHTVPMTTPVDEIISRGRKVRARRRIPVIAGTLAAATAATVLGLSLAGVFSAAPAQGAGTIRTEAFTLTRNADGTDTLTINQLVLLEPGTLQKDLARYGIPAIVETGRFCSSNPAPAGFRGAVKFSGHGTQQPFEDRKLTIKPSALPAGTELSFGSFQLPTETVFALINKNSYTCTSTVPTTPPPSGDLFAYSGFAP